MRGITGPVSPSFSTTRQQSLGRAAARERFESFASLYGLDGKAKNEERSIAIPADIGRPKWWLLINGRTAVNSSKRIYDYTHEVWEAALAIDDSSYLRKLTGARTKSRNACESWNTALIQCGESVNPTSTTCGTRMWVLPIANILVPCIDEEWIPGTDRADPANYRLIFAVPNKFHRYGVPD